MFEKFFNKVSQEDDEDMKYLESKREMLGDKKGYIELEHEYIGILENLEGLRSLSGRNKKIPDAKKEGKLVSDRAFFESHLVVLGKFLQKLTKQMEKIKDDTHGEALELNEEYNLLQKQKKEIISKLEEINDNSGDFFKKYPGLEKSIARFL